MNNWNIKEITLQQVESVCNYFGNRFSDLEDSVTFKNILASIMVRRNITANNDIMFFIERDLRFQHNPFLLSSMEDAVERILQAKEENEKVLVFGDSDVDGITSTAILYAYLKKLGIDVEYQLPQEDDGYGLSINSIDSFAEKHGTLIITVDCGISNFEEIAHANELGIDVIVTDHHNPPETLPEAIIIIDPKIESSGYPFNGISGAAVSYKLVSALRLYQTGLIDSEFCILTLTKDENSESYIVDAVKIHNLTISKRLTETIIPGKTSIYNMKLPYFLQGSIIYVWDANKVSNELKMIFGSGIEFNLTDLRPQISKVFPSLKSTKIEELANLSSLAKYFPEEKKSVNILFNLYFSYIRKIYLQKYQDLINDENDDLQLVALAALADIMPMKNENRILVYNGICNIHNKIRYGLSELLSALRINPENVTSTDLSWTVIPALNATGRLGKPDIALHLLSDNPKEREKLAMEIVSLNEERKNIVNMTIPKIQNKAKESLEKYNNKLCLVIDESMPTGLTGLIASRLMSEYKVPSIAITISNDICTGSMRSNRGFISTDFLDSFGDFFINHGGHNCAAGFSFDSSKLESFLEIIGNNICNINLEEEKEEYTVDAKIPTAYLHPDLFKLIDLFEPYGSENSELIFKTEKIKVFDGEKVGKKDPQHLKLSFEANNHKFPAIYWNQGDLLNSSIKKNDSCDILYSMNKNYFNGLVTKQLIIKDLQK